jgi:NitT/TauT family transport system permease protein
MGRVFGCSNWQIIFRIVIPAALPEIITGVRLAIVRAVKGVIVGQIVIALIGFGGLFNTYLSMFLMERFWALIIVVFTMSFTIISLVELLERRIAFYAKTR